MGYELTDLAPPIDRARHGQRVSSATVGDCFRASMSVLLGVPNGDHLPNTHDSRWMFRWWEFLGDFGLAMNNSHSKGPIWKNHPWIASVPSKNHAGCTHAIVVDGRARVLFDPSPKKRYRPRMLLLGADLVLGGTWIEVADARKLGAFVKWQAKMNA